MKNKKMAFARNLYPSSLLPILVILFYGMQTNKTNYMCLHQDIDNKHQEILVLQNLPSKLPKKNK